MKNALGGATTGFLTVAVRKLSLVCPLGGTNRQRTRGMELKDNARSDIFIAVLCSIVIAGYAAMLLWLLSRR